MKSKAIFLIAIFIFSVSSCSIFKKRTPEELAQIRITDSIARAERQARAMDFRDELDVNVDYRNER